MREGYAWVRPGSIVMGFGIVEEPELGVGGQEVVPVFGGAFYGEYGASGHVVQAYGAEDICEGGNARIVGKEGDGLVGVVEVRDYVLECLEGGVIKLGDELDIFFFLAKGFDKVFGGLAGAFGRARDETINGDACFDEALRHCGSIATPPVVQRTVNVADVCAVPAAFCVSNNK